MAITLPNRLSLNTVIHIRQESNLTWIVEKYVRGSYDVPQSSKNIDFIKSSSIINCKINMAKIYGRGKWILPVTSEGNLWIGYFAKENKKNKIRINAALEASVLKSGIVIANNVSLCINQYYLSECNQFKSQTWRKLHRRCFYGF